MKKKAKYETAEFEIILVEDSDVIATSADSWEDASENIDSGGWT